MSPGAAALVAAALVVCAAPPARAHDPGLSSLDLHVMQDRITAALSMAATDARTAAGARSTLDGFAAESIELWLDGARLPGRVESLTADDDGIRVTLAFGHTGGSRLTVRSAVIARLARGHRQLLTVRTDGDRGSHHRMLDTGTNAADFDLGSHADDGSVASRFLAHGMRHIAGGHDHLLFVGALLLGLRRLRSVITTITAFTVAHSVTLSLAVLGLVSVPASIVEPLIAASIVLVGIENLVSGQMDSRWKLTFAIGLLHGLGFAGALQDLGVGTGGAGVAAPLGWFNAGVELGQIGVVAIVWPLVQAVNARPAWRVRLAPACSVLVVAAGGYWLVERLMF